MTIVVENEASTTIGIFSILEFKLTQADTPQIQRLEYAFQEDLGALNTNVRSKFSNWLWFPIHKYQKGRKWRFLAIL